MEHTPLGEQKEGGRSSVTMGMKGDGPRSHGLIPSRHVYCSRRGTSGGRGEHVQNDRLILTDESRAGRPKSVVVPEKINAVRELIKQDRHVTYREIEASLDISDESWIYAYEPETKQQSTVWVFQDEAKPTKVVRGRSTSKQMIACFFGINGHVATVELEQRRTVNSEWYTTICLPEVIGEIRKKQKNRRIILHHDNASSHTSTQTKAFLTERKIELMGHPPLSKNKVQQNEHWLPSNGYKQKAQYHNTSLHINLRSLETGQ
ncbi:uncharacterized protein NPIL_598891 [Nephila pilipes]|uniref:Transposase n=1 Tax=Nephila pilipes TaxID=299642 RepID=A0A8X6N5P0_NEPPI|nr:uncharacterized protein NPIL_598891 [Nephila pilipes]